MRPQDSTRRFSRFSSQSKPGPIVPHEHACVWRASSDCVCRAFGGAAITMPFKVEIMKHVDTLTPSAKILGAVNTITPGGTNGDRVFVGDNTDWVRRIACARVRAYEAQGFPMGRSGCETSWSRVSKRIINVNLMILLWLSELVEQRVLEVGSWMWL